jgi:hypothetical protein
LYREEKKIYKKNFCVYDVCEEKIFVVKKKKFIKKKFFFSMRPRWRGGGPVEDFGDFWRPELASQNRRPSEGPKMARNRRPE